MSAECSNVFKGCSAVAMGDSIKLWSGTSLMVTKVPVGKACYPPYSVVAHDSIVDEDS